METRLHIHPSEIGLSIQEEYCVAIEVPGHVPGKGEQAPDLQPYCNPFDGRLYDVIPPTKTWAKWTITFLTSTEQLPGKLHKALMAGSIASYQVEVWNKE